MNSKKPNVIVVMPAYNAQLTLQKTYHAIPPGSCDSILLVDDHSRDRTVEVARELNLKVIEHPENRGYGANQKTCYTHALAMGADIMVMLHPDYQYDPRIIPDLVAPIRDGEADIVLASRMLGEPLKGGMPPYKFVFNKTLTFLENLALGTHFSEFHTGYRAYSRDVLQNINFMANSDDFIFDNQIIIQCLDKGFRFKEIPVVTSYAEDSSSVGFWRSVEYGFGIFHTIWEYTLHAHLGIRHPRYF